MADTSPPDTDVVVIGAGFAGLYMLHRLRSEGFRVQVVEAGSGVGGTWYWNRYPGARCDVQSMEYSYGFDEELEQEWGWTERYATQPEILRYLDHVADRFDLRRDIRFDTTVVAAAFDESASTWAVETSAGDTLIARYVVAATGCLSSANLPDIAGRDSFEGRSFHTGRWPHEGVDFSGRRVAVIGTGSSAVQSIPLIAADADQVVVLQRTPTYAVPAYNEPLDPEWQAEVKARYRQIRAGNRANVAGFGAITSNGTAPTSMSELDEARRREALDAAWERGGLGFLGAFADTVVNPDANEAVADYVRDRIRTVVDDPEVAALLTPTQPIGCKRLCVDTGYFETFNLPHVSLVDISTNGIDEITPMGIRVAGEVIEVDDIVFATGFDAMTGALARISFTGVDGRTLADAWAAGPVTYLGLGVPDFPNLFVVTGPGSPSVLTNMVSSIEQHVEWITDCLVHLRAEGASQIEAEHDSARTWVEYVNTVADVTLLPSCNSWYLGANIPGKPRVFMPLPGFGSYVAQCEDIAARGYEGFAIS
jgi:cation diffusion facilitator CzcD-associated flavoprotein CzcO